MPVLPDGRIQIRNKRTGETRIITPEQMGDYGISNKDYAGELQALKVIQEIKNPTPEVDPVAERTRQESLKQQRSLAGDLKQFVESYGDVEKLAKGGFGVTEAQLPRFLGLNVEKGVGSQLFPKAAAFDATKKSLAYTMASALAGQKGTGVSDKDVAFFEKELGGRSDSEEAFNLKVKNVVSKLERRLKESGATDEEVQQLVSGIVPDDAQNEGSKSTPSLMEFLDSVTKTNPAYAGVRQISRLPQLPGNAVQDVKDMASGIMGLPQVLQKVTSGELSPVDIIKAITSGTFNQYKNLLTDPGKEFIERPVSTSLELIPGLAGLKRLDRVGDVARSASKLDDVADVVKASRAADTISPNAEQLSKLTPEIQRVLNKASKAGVREGPSSLAKNVYQSVLNFSKKNKSFERLKPNETIGDMIQYGIAGSPDQIMTKMDTVTGRNGILSNVVNEAVAATTKPASLEDISSIKKVVRELQDSGFAELTDRDFDAIRAQIDNLPQLKTGRVGDYDVSKLLEYERKLQETAQKHRINGLSGDVRSKELADFKSSVAEKIGDIIDDKVNKAGTIERFKNPALISEIEKVSPKLAGQFKSAKSISEIRSLQKSFVRMKMMMDLVMQEPSGLGRNLFRAASQIPVVGPILDTVAQNAAIPLATKTALKIDDTISNPIIKRLLNR